MLGHKMIPNNKVTYGDGPFIKNAQVQLIFWGSSWKISPLNDTAWQIALDLAQLFAGPYMLGMSQYGNIAPASLNTYFPIFDDSTEPVEPVTGDNLAAYIKALIINGKVPDFRSNDQIVYAVFTDGFSSDVGTAAGWHRWNFLDGQAFHFAWMSAPLTWIASHEILETCSDPEGSGYTQTPPGIEICDICEDTYLRPAPDNSGTDLSDGIEAAAYWSNIDGRCIVPVRNAKILCSFLDDDGCKIGPIQGGTSTLRVGSIEVLPAWIDSSSLQPLVNPTYHWEFDDEDSVKPLGPNNQSTYQVQWLPQPDKYYASISVTITSADGNLVVRGRYDVSPLTETEAELAGIACNLKKVIASVNALPVFVFRNQGDPGPDPVLPTLRDIRQLKSIVDLLARDVERIASVDSKLRTSSKDASRR